MNDQAPPSDDEMQRVPPQNEEAEEAVIGAALLSGRAIDAIESIVDPSDFYKRAHGVIFKAILDLYANGDEVDLLTVADHLEKQGTLESIGGRVRIAELAALTTATSNVAHHARIVREMATLRGLIRAGLQIADLGWTRPGETGDLVDRAGQMVLDLSHVNVSEEVEAADTIAVSMMTRLQERASSGRTLIGVPTGLRDVDRLTSGMVAGNLIILAARPSMGKTALAHGMIAHASIRAGVPSALFTLEMSKEEVMQRLVAAEGSVESTRIRSGYGLTLNDWSAANHAAAKIAAAPIYIDDTGSLTLTDLRSKCRRLKLRVPNLGLIVVDYIQLMSSGLKAEGRVQEIGQISRSLKVLARDLNVPIVALSQLSRAVEQRHDKRPILSDLRESGSIEQDADLVAFIYRDEYYNPEEIDQRGMAELIVAKQRNGPTDTVRLAFVGKYARFASLEVHRIPGDMGAGE